MVMNNIEICSLAVCNFEVSSFFIQRINAYVLTM